MSNARPSLDEIASLAKRRGFIYQTSSIYGGLANSYDYGPLGAQLLKNIKDAWWRSFVVSRPDMYGLDSQILLHPKTWEASGHVSSFTDPLVEDKVTHKRYRADHLIEAWLAKQSDESLTSISVETMKTPEMAAFISEHNILSPDGNPITEPRDFNILFETEIGVVTGEKSKVYLRGETAQGIFTNFKNILDTTRAKLPFGVGQMGKSFRNEITTGQFVFRTVEFEQAEIEYFFDPNLSNWEALLKDWQDHMWRFVTKNLGIREENLRWRRHSDAERSFYSKDTYDLDYQYPFGWKELWGVAYRTDYDLKQHSQYSGEDLIYLNPQTGEKITPHVIEPAVGVNRLLLMCLCDAYWQDTERNRVVLKLNPAIAPYQVAVFPLVKNKPELVAQAQEIFQTLGNSLAVTWDDRGNIGKRYLSQDEVGTPFCVTVDYQTLEDQTVTVRDRDTAEQSRVAISELVGHLHSMIR